MQGPVYRQFRISDELIKIEGLQRLSEIDNFSRIDTSDLSQDSRDKLDELRAARRLFVDQTKQCEKTLTKQVKIAQQYCRDTYQQRLKVEENLEKWARSAISGVKKGNFAFWGSGVINNDGQPALPPQTNFGSQKSQMGFLVANKENPQIKPTDFDLGFDATGDFGGDFGVVRVPYVLDTFIEDILDKQKTTTNGYALTQMQGRLLKDIELGSQEPERQTVLAKIAPEWKKQQLSIKATSAELHKSIVKLAESCLVNESVCFDWLNNSDTNFEFWTNFNNQAGEAIAKSIRAARPQGRVAHSDSDKIPTRDKSLFYVEGNDETERRLGADQFSELEYLNVSKLTYHELVKNSEMAGRLTIAMNTDDNKRELRQDLMECKLNVSNADVIKFRRRTDAEHAARMLVQRHDWREPSNTNIQFTTARQDRIRSTLRFVCLLLRADRGPQGAQTIDINLSDDVNFEDAKEEWSRFENRSTTPMKAFLQSMSHLAKYWFTPKSLPKLMINSTNVFDGANQYFESGQPEPIVKCTNTHKFARLTEYKFGANQNDSIVKALEAIHWMRSVAGHGVHTQSPDSEHELVKEASRMLQAITNTSMLQMINLQQGMQSQLALTWSPAASLEIFVLETSSVRLMPKSDETRCQAMTETYLLAQRTSEFLVTHQQMRTKLKTYDDIVKSAADKFTLFEFPLPRNRDDFAAEKREPKPVTPSSKQFEELLKSVRTLSPQPASARSVNLVQSETRLAESALDDECATYAAGVLSACVTLRGAQIATGACHKSTELHAARHTRTLVAHVREVPGALALLGTFDRAWAALGSPGATEADAAASEDALRAAIQCGFSAQETRMIHRARDATLCFDPVGVRLSDACLARTGDSFAQARDTARYVINRLLKSKNFTATDSVIAYACIATKNTPTTILPTCPSSPSPCLAGLRLRIARCQSTPHPFTAQWTRQTWARNSPSRSTCYQSSSARTPRCS